MDLNDLLAEVEGIGGDRYMPSARAAEAPKPAAAPVLTAFAESEPSAVAVAVAEIDELDVMPDVLPETLSLADALAPAPVAPPPDFGSLDMVLDVELELTVELGELRLPLKQLLHLQQGDRLALGKRQDEPVTILVDGRAVARGEALVVDGSLAVKITEILAEG